MAGQATTLGELIAERMRKYNHSNRSLAQAAGVSDTAIRNLLKFGVVNGAKEPDAQTLRKVAVALDVEPIRLFRLAGYIPADDRMYSTRAEYLAKVFDTLSEDRRQAILAVIETMLPESQVHVIGHMKADARNPLAGLDINFPPVVRQIANQLIVMYRMTEPPDVHQIEPDAKIMQFNWAELPVATQERVKALIRHKLSLDYDPTMVDPEWRE